MKPKLLIASFQEEVLLRTHPPPNSVLIIQGYNCSSKKSPELCSQEGRGRCTDLRNPCAPDGSTPQPGHLGQSLQHGALPRTGITRVSDDADSGSLLRSVGKQYLVGQGCGALGPPDVTGLPRGSVKRGNQAPTCPLAFPTRQRPCLTELGSYPLERPPRLPAPPRTFPGFAERGGAASAQPQETRAPGAKRRPPSPRAASWGRRHV